MRSFTILTIILLSACENKIEDPKGEQGIAGVKGDKGDPGSQDPKGDKGDQGATGLQGIQGLQGIAGEKGDPGSIGLTGAQGPKGEPGQIGLPGSEGTSCVGQSVPEGVLVTCVNGSFLVKHGDVGPTGPKGDKGDPGSIGLPGKDFVAGCPTDSTSVILDGILVYCHWHADDVPLTLQKCIGVCAKHGMSILTFEGKTLLCLQYMMTNVGFAQKTQYWIKDFVGEDLNGNFVSDIFGVIKGEFCGLSFSEFQYETKSITGQHSCYCGTKPN